MLLWKPPLRVRKTFLGGLLFASTQAWARCSAFSSKAYLRNACRFTRDSSMALMLAETPSEVSVYSVSSWWMMAMVSSLGRTLSREVRLNLLKQRTLKWSMQFLIVILRAFTVVKAVKHNIEKLPTCGEVVLWIPL